MDKTIELQELVSRLRIDRLYHFAALANTGQIYQHKGMYSRCRHAEVGIQCQHFVSDDKSRANDSRNGLDKYIHLSFVRDHPMLHVSRKRNSHFRMLLLHINPKVLLLEGVMFTEAMANSMFSSLYPVLALSDHLPLKDRLPDTDVPGGSWTLEQFVDWKAQLLVPDFIPLNLVLRFEDL
jgi:hypothetical protein